MDLAKRRRPFLRRAISLLRRRLRKKSSRGRRRSAAAGATLPRTFKIPRGGEVCAQAVNDWSELVGLRGELERLRLSALGDSALALRALCDAGSGDGEVCAAAGELRDGLLDARHAVVEQTIAEIDSVFPEAASEVCYEAEVEAARSLRQRVIEWLRAAPISESAELAGKYAASANLAPGDVDRHADESPESEAGMTDAEDTNVNETSAASTTTDGADSVEEALASMEDELKDLTGLVSSEGEEGVPTAETVGDTGAEEAVGAEAAASAESSAADAVESAAEDAQPESAPPEETGADAVAASSPAVAPESSASESAAPESVEPESAEPVSAPTDPAPTAGSVEEIPAVTETEGAAAAAVPPSPPPPEPVQRAPFTPTSRFRYSSGRTNRPPADEVSSAIENMAGFLLDEVSRLWTEARTGMEEIVAYREEVQRTHQQVTALHGEITKMRGEVASSRGEAAQLRAQIENVRDDAARARQRADASALEAQSAADQAAAAAREAETAARFQRGT